ncbi:MAG: thermonuclease family protein [Alphaproteobacteria bacterium]|nr:thermonuclease family protein [Alphaproteobacteria bacterium]
MKRTTLALIALSLLAATAAAAQEMPAPRRMPRAPVSREILASQHEATPATRQIQGQAAIIDGEKLRIGDVDLRLFGVVPPQLSASFGPQARAELDALAAGHPVSCTIRDRGHDGRLLATCANANGEDMALALLKHGLAVTARGSIADTELAAPYSAAEQAAENQKIGLWSVAVGTATVPAPALAPPPPKQESAVLLAGEAENGKNDKIAPHPDKAAALEAPLQAKIAADILAQQAQARLDDAPSPTGEEAGFFERYQILIAGLLMLATAIGIMGSLAAQKIRDRREERRAVAAALRGELMAARGVCLGRARSIASEAEDHAALWPRIRATLYQAYVGRLGLMGAELARQIASLYGQSSDYAALYSPTSAGHDAPKKQALEALARHIEEVLPKLAEIEQTGHLPKAARSHAPRLQSDAAVSVAAEIPQAGVEDASVAIVNAPAPVPTAGESPAVVRTTLALWESVRGFIQNHRSALQTPPQPQPFPIDPQTAEYAAMIEADMARYQYGEPIEPLDIAPQKRRG